MNGGSGPSAARGTVEHEKTSDPRDGSPPSRAQNQQAVAVEGRSRWQTVLVEAGGLGAAVSEESLKSLRYCLQWLLVSDSRLVSPTPY
jgi:hypothetical protein